MTDQLAPAGASRVIRLVVADVDGTLLTPEKILTPRARAAVHALIDAGIAFTITSGRPPLGLKAVIDALPLTHPISAFNGGLFVRPDLSVMRERLIPLELVRPVIGTLTRGGLDVWVYTDTDWRVRTRHAPHVDREERTVRFPPSVVPDFSDALDRVIKIVAVSDDAERMARCVAHVQRMFGPQLSAALSQPYYLDVTHPKANKGEVVRVLAGWLAVPPEHIATIGDMPNDVLMFERSGTSIAMANARPDVRRAATFVTTANSEEGFAEAMERFILRATHGGERQWSH